jgi:hypothetical protein
MLHAAFWLHCCAPQVNHRFVTTLKEDGDQRIYWKTLQVCEAAFEHARCSICWAAAFVS